LRTETKLYEEFGNKKHNWQSKQLQAVDDLMYVIQNLLKKKFVVDIEGNKYDISFGVSKGLIGYGWSSSPSPHLMSWEIIEKGFREGKWFVVLDQKNRGDVNN
jgi:hypothetical protein